MVSDLRQQDQVDVARWSSRVAIVTVVLLSVGAWALLLAWDASAYGRYFDHHGITDAGLSPVPAVAVFVSAWVLMLIGMMLPSTHSLVAVFARVVGSRRDRGRLLGALFAGYLVMWTAVGLVALGFDLALHELVERSAWLHDNEWAITAAVLTAAGVYQFSPVKDRCLAACRSPQTFVFGRWRGRSALRESFVLGAAHGKFCVGCCIALMLVMFGVGVGSIGWMLALGAVMTLEKVAPWGDRLVAPVGVALPLLAAGVVGANI